MLSILVAMMDVEFYRAEAKHCHQRCLRDRKTLRQPRDGVPCHATTTLLLTNSKRPSRGAVLRTSVQPVEQRTRVTRVTVISDAARVRRSFAVRARRVHVNYTQRGTGSRVEQSTSV